MATLLVTVGSTSFAALTDFVMSDAALIALYKLGFQHVIVQHGTHIPRTVSATTNAIDQKPKLTKFAYTQTLNEHMSAASIIISHAGAGTILEVIDRGKPLIVVINSTLMDDHQTELARAMEDLRCCRVVQHAHISSQLLQAVTDALADAATRPNPPRRSTGVFSAIVAEELNEARKT